MLNLTPIRNESALIWYGLGERKNGRNAVKRLRLRREALELVASAIEATDPAECMRLLVQARVLSETADREYGSDPLEPLIYEPIR
jgi:hypothetical protein